MKTFIDELIKSDASKKAQYFPIHLPSNISETCKGKLRALRRIMEYLGEKKSETEAEMMAAK